jgi:hypothetical protein
MARRIKQRAFDILGIPNNDAMADGLQILRYRPGQLYVVHQDYHGLDSTPADEFNWDPSDVGGCNRFATFFLYLKAPKLGGQTVFPAATPTRPQKARNETLEIEVAQKLCTHTRTHIHTQRYTHTHTHTHTHIQTHTHTQTHTYTHTRTYMQIHARAHTHTHTHTHTLSLSLSQDVSAI